MNSKSADKMDEQLSIINNKYKKLFNTVLSKFNHLICF